MAIITGRAVAYAFVKEGAAVMIPYLNEHRDAQATKQRIKELGGRCVLYS
jgi:NAD(P)-dependent dehydrogenase (short-subunit alcohol dehydrogenase family)